MPEPKCSECRHAVLEEYGYSEVTIEGDFVYCIEGLSPYKPFDRWFGKAKEDLFAAQCPQFETGGPGLAMPYFIDEKEKEEFRAGLSDEQNVLMTRWDLIPHA